MAITFNPALFRQQFPAYADAIAYPDAALQIQFNIGTGFVSADTYGDLADSVRIYILNLMTAHLVALGDIIKSGSQPGLVTASSIGDVRVTLQPPPERGQWRYWLNLTPYGAQLAALLDAQSVGGLFVGGLPERAAFRKVGGVF